MKKVKIIAAVLIASCAFEYAVANTGISNNNGSVVLNKTYAVKDTVPKKSKTKPTTTTTPTPVPTPTPTMPPATTPVTPTPNPTSPPAPTPTPVTPSK